MPADGSLIWVTLQRAKTAREAIKTMDALCQEYGLGVLLDMHAWIGSQNGLDNSGETKFVVWASKFDSGTSGEMYVPRTAPSHPLFLPSP